jgi:hypothetical protein
VQQSAQQSAHRSAHHARAKTFMCLCLAYSITACCSCRVVLFCSRSNGNFLATCGSPQQASMLLNSSLVCCASLTLAPGLCQQHAATGTPPHLHGHEAQRSASSCGFRLAAAAAMQHMESAAREERQPEEGNQQRQMANTMQWCTSALSAFVYSSDLHTCLHANA